MEKEKLVFTRNEDYKGYNVKAWYLKEPSTDALIETMKGDVIVKTFLFPAYKVYNVGAHFTDIVDTEIYNSLPPFVRNPHYKNGYRMAAWNGIS